MTIFNLKNIEELKIVGIYRRPECITSINTWENILRHFKNNNIDNEFIIIMGDFNAHHTIWNCGNIDKNGENLLEAMENNDLYLVNGGTLSRIGEGGTNDSNLDLIFCTEKVFSIISCKQKKDTWGSDHFPIIAEIKVKKENYIKKTNRISKKKTKWKIYEKEILKKEFILDTENYQNKNLEGKYEYLADIMKEAVRIATYGEEEVEKFRIRNDKRKRRNDVLEIGEIKKKQTVT